MSSTSEVESWVRAEYHRVGLGQDGKFVGKDRFKKILLQHPRRPQHVESLKIRQTVNS